MKGNVLAVLAALLAAQVLSVEVVESDFVHLDETVAPSHRDPLPTAKELSMMSLHKIKDAIMEKMRRMYKLRTSESTEMAKVSKLLSDEKDAAQQQALAIGATGTLNRMMKAARVDIVKYHNKNDIKEHKPLETAQKKP